MNIIKATKMAQEKDTYMQRTGGSWPRNTKIKPTDLGYDVEIVYIPIFGKAKERRPMWNPKTEDVLADDWTICN